MAKKRLSKNSLLWEITNKETEIVSYVYGTIHLKDNRVYFLIDKVKELIAECDILMAEYPLDDASDNHVMEMLHLPNGKHLKDYIDEKKYIKLNKYIKKSFGVDLEKFGYFKPMVLENILTETIFETDYDAPMDMVLWEFAKELGKETIGAETTDSQLKIMEKLSLKKQIKSLLEIGKNIAKFRKNIKKLISYYINQELPKLHKKSLKSLGKMKHILVYNRNIKITESIQKYSKDKKVFVAIGAGHLLGEKGVLRLLKKSGYKVKAIR